MKNFSSVFPSKVVSSDDGHALLVGGIDLHTYLLGKALPGVIQAYPQTAAVEWAKIADMAARESMALLEQRSERKKRGAK